MVNGVTVNENLRGPGRTTSTSRTPIQETTVATAGVSAEYGRFSGGVVNVITKSGGNMLQRLVPRHADQRQLADADAVPRNDAHCRSTDAQGPAHRRRSCRNTSSPFGGRSCAIGSGSSRPAASQTQESGRTAGRHQHSLHLQRQDTAATRARSPTRSTSNHRFQGRLRGTLRTEVNNTFNTNAVDGPAQPVHRQLPDNLLTVSYSGVLTPHALRRRPLLGAASSLHRLGRQVHRPHRRHAPHRQQPRQPALLVADTSAASARRKSATTRTCFVKGSYVPVRPQSRFAQRWSSATTTFNDMRNANNHQSGSDYRILGTATTIVGTGESSVIYPVFLGNGTTIIQWNPIPIQSKGSNFRTNALFLNDQWRCDRPAHGEPRPALGQEPRHGSARARWSPTTAHSARASASSGIRPASRNGR